jgi:hypothetical protein
MLRQGSLVSKPTLLTAVRAGPSNSVAGHAPHIFFHAVRTDLKAAPAGPAEGKISAAQMAVVFLSSSSPFLPGCRFCLLYFHKVHCFWAQSG